jgi:hypothetical protein
LHFSLFTDVSYTQIALHLNNCKSRFNIDPAPAADLHFKCDLLVIEPKRRIAQELSYLRLDIRLRPLNVAACQRRD